MKPDKRELSYYATVMSWDGKVFAFDPDQVHAQLQQFDAAGIRWLGVQGINLEESFGGLDIVDVVRRSGAWIDELGLNVSSFHFAGPTFAPLAESQDAVRRNFVRNVEVFAPLRPRAFVIHAGWIQGENLVDGVKDGVEAECARHGMDAVIDTLAANLKFFGQAAAPHGIRLALETMGSILLPFGGEEDLPRLIAAVDEPNVGYCLDSGHVHLSGESVVDWVVRCGDRLFETHFHDNRGRGKDEHLPVSFGTIDWPGVIQALDRIGFSGPVTFECGGWPGLDTIEGYRQAMAWWRACESLAGTVQ